MAHKNYSKYSESSKKTENKPLDGQMVIEEVLTTEEVENLKVEEVAEVNTDGNLTGIVTGCERLNMRNKADKDSDVITILAKDTEVIINTSESTTEEFYKVSTHSGLEGYCMKKYISIK